MCVYVGWEGVGEGVDDANVDVVRDGDERVGVEVRRRCVVGV